MTRTIMAAIAMQVCGCLIAVGADFNVRTFGARGDGTAKDTVAFQNALDACAKSGGGRVVVPLGTYLIGSIYLGDNTELHLQEGATLLGSPDLADYNAPDAYQQNWGSVKEGWSAKHLVLALEKKGVSITGHGVIDGNGRAFFDDKPQFTGIICWRDGAVNARDSACQGRPGPEIVFVECRDVTVRDVTLRDMCCWSCLFHGCDKVVVGGVTVRNGLSHLNTDGFDVDSCRNVTIGDCDIETGDDAIAIRGSPARLKDKARVCENVRVSNIVCHVSADGVRVGVGNGTIRNVHISDMKIEHAGRGLHVQSCYGKGAVKGVDISDVSFERIEIRDSTEAVLVGIGNDEGDATIKGISFSRVSADALVPSIIVGNEKNIINDVKFSDCSFMIVQDSDETPDDDEAGTLRCGRNSVFRIQHTDAVLFSGCKFHIGTNQVQDIIRVFSLYGAAQPKIE